MVKKIRTAFDFFFLSGSLCFLLPSIEKKKKKKKKTKIHLQAKIILPINLKPCAGT